MTADTDARQLLRQAVQVWTTSSSQPSACLSLNPLTHLQVAVSHPAPAEGWDPSLQPPEILLGILSSDIRLAVRALRDWTNALHLPFVIPKSRVRGSAIGSMSNWFHPFTCSEVLGKRNKKNAAGGRHLPNHKLVRLCLHQVQCSESAMLCHWIYRER